MALIEIRDVLDNETGKTIFPRTHVKAVIGLEDFSFFEKVQDADDPTKFSVKLKSGYTGLWTEGWLAAGGVGSGSGGGSGVDLTRVWQSLTNNTDFPDTKINVAHIPDLTTGKITDLESWIAAKGYAVASAIPTESTVAEWGFTKNEGTVTSVTLTSGTGITVSNSGTAITVSGSREIGISQEYQDKIARGVAANGWGNHAEAGYLKSSALNDYALKTGAWTYNFQVNSIVFSSGSLSGPNIISGTRRLHYTYTEGGASVDDPETTVTKTVAYLDDITHQTIYGLTLYAGAFSAGTYTPNSAAASFNIPTTLDHISDGETRKLANYLPLTGGTMTGAITMSGTGANIVPEPDDVNYLGASDKRFHAGFIRDLYLSYLRFVDGTTRAERGTFSMGDGYAQVSLSGTNAANYMFYSANGFFMQGGGVPLGRSDHRWSNIYSVDADITGVLSLCDSQGVKHGEIRTPGAYWAFRTGVDFNQSYKQLTFHESYGFYPETAGVNLGYNGTNYRWANIYGVNADLSGNLSLSSTSYIDIGPVRIKFENNALHITKKDSADTETYGLYADGFVSAGGVQQTS